MNRLTFLDLQGICHVCMSLPETIPYELPRAVVGSMCGRLFSVATDLIDQSKLADCMGCLVKAR